MCICVYIIGISIDVYIYIYMYREREMYVYAQRGFRNGGSGPNRGPRLRPGPLRSPPAT